MYSVKCAKLKLTLTVFRHTSCFNIRESQKRLGYTTNKKKYKTVPEAPRKTPTHYLFVIQIKYGLRVQGVARQQHVIDRIVYRSVVVAEREEAVDFLY